MMDFNDFWDEVKERVAELAKKSWKDFADEVQEDGKSFLEGIKEDLKRWTKLLAHGSITKEEYEWLVLSKKDLIELEALKQAGLGKIRLQRLKNTLIDIVIDTAFDRIV